MVRKLIAAGSGWKQYRQAVACWTIRIYRYRISNGVGFIGSYPATSVQFLLRPAQFTILQLVDGQNIALRIANIVGFFGYSRTGIDNIFYDAVLHRIVAIRYIRNDSTGGALEGFKFAVGVVGLTCSKEMLRVLVRGDKTIAVRLRIPIRYHT